MLAVKIDLKDASRHLLFTVHVDLQKPPTMVRSPLTQKEMYLDWNQAIDDENHLRRCPVCGCRDLFVRKNFPGVTAFVLIALAAVVAMALFSTQHTLAAIAVLLIVLVVDVLVLFFARRSLVCYRCGSEYRELKIRSDHPRWHPATAERYRFEPPLTLPISTASASPPPASPSNLDS